MLNIDISPWCQSDDPVVRDSVLNARALTFGHLTQQTVQRCISRLEEIIAWAEKQNPLPHFDLHHDPCAPRDPIDILVDLHEYCGWRPPGANLPDILHLLVLRESALGHYTLAVKAYYVGKYVLASSGWERTVDGRRKGGRTITRKDAIWRFTLGLVEKNPKISAKAAWNTFPESFQTIPDRFGFEVYQDGDKLIQRNPAGNDESITFNSYRRYVTNAKDFLRSN